MAGEVKDFLNIEFLGDGGNWHAEFTTKASIVSGSTIELNGLVHTLHATSEIHVPEVDPYYHTITPQFTEGVAEVKELHGTVQPTTGTFVSVHYATITYDGGRSFAVDFLGDMYGEILKMNLFTVTYQSPDAITESISSIEITGNTTKAKGAAFRLQNKPKKGTGITIYYRFAEVYVPESDPDSDTFTAGEVGFGGYSCGGNACTEDNIIMYDGDDLIRIMAYGYPFRGLTVQYVADDSGGGSGTGAYGFYDDKSKAPIEGITPLKVIQATMLNLESLSVPANSIRSVWGAIPIVDDEDKKQILGIIRADSEGGGVGTLNISFVTSVNLSDDDWWFEEGEDGVALIGVFVIQNVTSSSVTIRPMGAQADFTYIKK